MVIDSLPDGNRDRAAFEHAALPLLGYLRGRAVVLTGNSADADDLVQDTIALGLRKFRMFRPGTNLKAWLGRLQFNLYVSSYRRRKKRPDGIALQDVVESEARSSTGAEDEVLRKMEPAELASSPVLLEGLSQEVMHGLHDLDHRYREVLLLNAVCERTYQEIATKLCVPVGTVMSRLSRAKAHMREFLSAQIASAN